MTTRMGPDLLSRNLADLLTAAQLCIQSRLATPALVLLYSAIDIAAWLDTDNPAAAVKTRFVSWVDKYLLPASPLRCTALELYAARCGVVHTFTADSELSRQGAARKIVYAWGGGRADTLHEMTQLAEMSGWVPVQIEDLIEGYRLGVLAFLAGLDEDADKATRVFQKAQRFFIQISPEERAGLLRWAKELLGGE